MRRDKAEELEKLEQTNEELVKFMREYPKETLSLASIGHSIANGFSVSEPGKLLLNRNLGLIDYGKKNGLNVETYHLTRWENNNSLSVAEWIRRNLTEQDTDEWNKVDYRRAMFNGKPLFTEEQIQDKLAKPFINMEDVGITILYKPKKSSATLAFNFVVPANYTWDGASIPRICWRLIGPKTDPRFLIASMIHDTLYIMHKYQICISFWK